MNRADVVETLYNRMASVREDVRITCNRAGRDPCGVQVLVAGKYVHIDNMPILSEAGITLVGENKAQDMAAKHARYGDTFTWDFIGGLQVKNVRRIPPTVRLIHSVCDLSVVEEIDKRASRAMDVLLQVNIGEEDSKHGIMLPGVDRFLREASESKNVNLVGLMTMPPAVDDDEENRPIFAALRELAGKLSAKWNGRYCFDTLSMGTSQDYAVAVGEGATIIRIGHTLFDGLSLDAPMQS